jgi:nitroimidazol reductase NimA-like FMN-containing flavoprotein (pyridoxamine 5'-phosphate oxidase superfamily)
MLRKIAQNNRVCFTITGSAELVPGALTTKYESIVVFGNAFVVDENELEIVMSEMVKKYFPDKIKGGGKDSNNTRREEMTWKKTHWCNELTLLLWNIL